jgi:putative transposase
VELLAAACQRIPMRVLGWCLLPEQFHVVVRPYEDDDLGRWVQGITTAHAGRFNRDHKFSGHVWAGRYKAFPIQADEHLLTVLRFVERAALRAELVDRAEDWRWSSLAHRLEPPKPPLLSPSPVKLPAGWKAAVNRPQRAAEEKAIETSIHRGSPYGGEKWTAAMVKRLGLESTVRPRGRPRIHPAK